MGCKYWIVVFLAISSALGQTPAGHETAFGAEFRLERGRFRASCLGQTPDGPTADTMAPESARGASIFGCAELLFTDHPFHIAAGSIAPQNGFGAGLALVTHYDGSKWLVKGDFDAVGSANGSWRAGAYIKLVPTSGQAVKPHGIGVHVSGTTQPAEKQSQDKTEKPHASELKVSPYPIFTLYAQGISLNKIGFFGLGQNNTTAGRSFFGMTETIVGGNAVVPTRWSKKLNLSLLGEINGRFVSIRGAHNEPSPSIEVLYTPVTAPGLATQPAFLQFGEGLRIMPAFEYLQLNYLANFQQFIAPGNSTFSFRRFNIDLAHEVPLWGHTKDKSAVTKNQIAKLTSPDMRKNNGPDDCGSEGNKVCPATILSTMCTEDATGKCTEVQSAISRNREGSLGVRLLISESIASGGSVVPFYFQPTLGGSDINGDPSLSSYQDYRFRAPSILLLRENLDHSLYGPVGLTLIADQGKAALTRGQIDFQHLRHSFAAGLNIRAGGLPAISVLYAFGGGEGTHISTSVNPALLAGSPRPSLF